MSELSRRGFLGLIGGVAAGAAVRSWPFRVFSFPTEVSKPWARVVEPHVYGLSPVESAALTIEQVERNLKEMWDNYTMHPDYIFVLREDLPLVEKILDSRTDRRILAPMT